MSRWVHKVSYFTILHEVFLPQFKYMHLIGYGQLVILHCWDSYSDWVQVIDAALHNSQFLMQITTTAPWKTGTAPISLKKANN